MQDTGGFATAVDDENVAGWTCGKLQMQNYE